MSSVEIDGLGYFLLRGREPFDHNGHSDRQKVTNSASAPTVVP